MKRNNIFMTWVLLVFLVGHCCLAADLEIGEGIGPCETRTAGGKYSPFWEPFKNLDFPYLEENNVAFSEDETLFYHGFTWLCQGDLWQAATAFLTLSRTVADPEMKEVVETLLFKTWFQLSAWEEILGAQDDSILASCPLQREYAPYAKILSQFPAEEYLLEKGGTAPLKFTFLTGHPVVEVKIRNKKYWLTLSMGSPLTVLSSKIQKELGLETAGQFLMRTDADAGEGIETQLAVVDLTIGQSELKNHPVVIMDRKYLEHGPVKFDGMLGWKALRNISLLVDGVRKRVEVGKQYRNESGSRRNFFWCGDSLPVVSLSNLNGGAYLFAVDTSFNNTSIFESILAKVDSSEVFTKRMKTVTIGAVKEEEVKVLPELALRLVDSSLFFKGIKATDSLPAFVNWDGILGYDLLKKGVIHMDYPGGFFVVEKGGKAGGR